MANVKVRKIDFSPDEFLVGIAGMKPFDIGVYWVACALEISSGKPIHINDPRLFSMLDARAPDIKASLNRLVSASKLHRNGDELTNKRVQNEIKRAARRIRSARENGVSGGRPRKQINKIEKGLGFSEQKLDEKLSLTTTTHHTSSPQEEKQEARSACADEPASEDDLEIPIEMDQQPEAKAVKIYNATAAQFGWAQCAKLSAARRAKLKARLRDCGGLAGWGEAMAKAGASPFLRGETGRSNGHENWKPNIEFFLQESSFLKLTEGAYGGVAGAVIEPPDGVDPVEWFAKNLGVSREIQH